jgi:hypothetical protein
VSQTNFFIDNARNAVKHIVDNHPELRDRLPAVVYKTFMDNLFSPQPTSMQQALNQYLDEKTQQQWRNNGVSREQLSSLLQTWTFGTLDQVVAYIRQQGGQQQYGNQQPGCGYQQPHTASPTNNMYNGGGLQTPPQQVVVPQTFTPMEFNNKNTPAVISTDYELGTKVMFDLSRVSNAEFQQPTNGILKISELLTGEHENNRLLSAEIAVRVAQNTNIDVGRLVFHNAPQEVIRGIFANIVFYQELFHVPVSYKEFCSVADAVWAAFSKDNNWRSAMRVLESKTKGEWDIMNRALCRLLNDLIYRRIRANQHNVCILGIDSLEDLFVMDDRTTNYPVVKHKEYWSTFNTIVNNAIDALFNPDVRIGPDDENFGDFIHCTEVDFYSNGHSKYDYGVFKEQVNRRAFIDQMLTTNTVIRVSRATIFTNALDPRLITKVQNGRPEDQLLLNTVNTVGTTLLNKLEYPKRGDVESIICLHQEAGVQTYEQLRIGKTLDQDIVLLA